MSGPVGRRSSAKAKHGREGVDTPRRPPALPIASLRRDRSSQTTTSVFHIFVCEGENVTRHFAASRHGAVTQASKKPTLRHESAGRSQPNVASARKKAILWRNAKAIRHE
jgi:hypothetical protein